METKVGKNVLKFLLVFIVLGVAIGFFLKIIFQTDSDNPQDLNKPTPKTVTISPDVTVTQEFDDSLWWEKAIFYQIFVRSFFDSDGNGIGDFNGIIQKMDYLNDGDPLTTTDLGITAIWLMPIFPSNSYHGYDVTNYFSVNPQYGTMDEFKNLLTEAHHRGVHVILDLVINHTSAEHPWFIEAQGLGSNYHPWYIWSNEDPGYLGPWGEKVWHKAENGQYYYGVFYSGMPDLNFLNPEVSTKMEEVTFYWLNTVGVDGFRVDGARHLIEDNKIQENSKPTLGWFKDYLELIKEWKPEAFTVGEIWDSSYVTTSYLKNQSFDMVFNFDLASAIISTVNIENAEALSANIEAEVELYNYQGMGTFLANHDMNRVLSQMGGDLRKAKHAATILMTIPGTPFLYYGEEIGMMGVKPDENIRTPMHWSGEKDAGFTTGKPWRPVNFDYETNNVSEELLDENSLLALYRNLIQTRSQHLALIIGDYVRVSSSDPALYTHLRVLDDDFILTIANLSDREIDQPVLRFPRVLTPGTYLMKILLGNSAIETEVEVKNSGDYLELKLLHPILSHQNLLVQLLPIP